LETLQERALAWKRIARSASQTRWLCRVLGNHVPGNAEDGIWPNCGAFGCIGANLRFMLEPTAVATCVVTVSRQIMVIGGLVVRF